jgi:tetratricopeptide (TPR) repeat protein
MPVRVLPGIAILALVLAQGPCAPHPYENTPERIQYFGESGDTLEAELAKKPGNEWILEHLISQHCRPEGERDKCQQYTLEMAKHHPANPIIYFRTVREFYLDTEFRDEVIGALEAQIPDHEGEAGLLWNLARITEREAIPPLPKDASKERRARWFRYFGIPRATQIPTTPDYELAAKAEHYYREAISLVEGDEFYYSFYSGHLADLLADVGRESEAIALYEEAIRSTPKEYRPDLHEELGHLHRSRGDFAKAAASYRRAIRTDRVGYENSGHVTANSYNALGLMAFEKGNIRRAERMLLRAATKSNPCCHNTTWGMPLRLARQLVEYGRYQAPKRYLELVLKKFTPCRQEVLDLLGQAKQLETEALVPYNY